MKVVLFCGGLGMRLREYSRNIPKPMVDIGYRPILWHVMKYYAHYGHKEFILCLGYRADTIKNYFLNYDECLSNDFVLSDGGKNLQLINSDIHDWKITFVDTGLSSSIGQRLKAVEQYLVGEEIFMANYSDGLTDLPLPEYIDCFKQTKKVAAFLSVRPTQSFHVVQIAENGVVRSIEHIRNSDIWMNAGYFLFRKEIFDYIKDGEELVKEPFARLIQEQQLFAYQSNQFWACMDTFKDKQLLDDLHAQGEAPWEIWNSSPTGTRNMAGALSGAI